MNVRNNFKKVHIEKLYGYSELVSRSYIGNLNNLAISYSNLIKVSFSGWECNYMCIFIYEIPEFR